jgi:hypothetical protein
MFPPRVQWSMLVHEPSLRGGVVVLQPIAAASAQKTPSAAADQRRP